MKRTTISLREGSILKARRVAAWRGVSFAQVVRDALDAYLDGPAGWDPPRSLGIADSGGAARGRDLGTPSADAFGRSPR